MYKCVFHWMEKSGLCHSFRSFFTIATDTKNTQLGTLTCYPFIYISSIMMGKKAVKKNAGKRYFSSFISTNIFVIDL